MEQRPDRRRLAARFLDKTAEILKRSGWCQGRHRNTLGQYCLLGAMGASFGYVDPADESYRIYSDCLDIVGAAISSLGAETIATWNDNPKRTFQDVMDLLYKVRSDLGPL